MCYIWKPQRQRMLWEEVEETQTILALKNKKKEYRELAKMHIQLP